MELDPMSIAAIRDTPSGCPETRALAAGFAVSVAMI